VVGETRVSVGESREVGDASGPFDMLKQDLRKSLSTLIGISIGRDTAGEGTMSVKTDE